MKKMKRALSLLLLICMLTSCLVPGVAAAPEDSSGTLRFNVTLPEGVTAEPVVTVQDANGQAYTAESWLTAIICTQFVPRAALRSWASSP